jgi:hypothetical protein
MKNPITILFNEDAQRDFFSDIKEAMWLKTYEPPKEGLESS